MPWSRHDVLADCQKTLSNLRSLAKMYIVARALGVYESARHLANKEFNLSIQGSHENEDDGKGLKKAGTALHSSTFDDGIQSRTTAPSRNAGQSKI